MSGGENGEYLSDNRDCRELDLEQGLDTQTPHGDRAALEKLVAWRSKE